MKSRQYIHRNVTVALVLTTVALGCSSDGETGVDTGPAWEPAVFETETHRFEEYAPGVYLARGSGAIFVQSNAMVIVNEEDVVVVDSHVSAAAGRALRDSIGQLTDKPIRFLINTHYHFDHAHGNQVFAQDVIIVGHEFTRQKLLGDPLSEITYQMWTSGLPAVVEQMRARLADLEDETQRQQLELQIAVQAAHVEALSEVVPTPPTMTLSSKMTLERGERTIELHFLGRGHTGGDVVVYLPEERIVFTGDLLVPGPSYMGDGYVGEWTDTLERLKELDFDWLLPGHGEATQDREYIDLFQAVLGSLWGQATEARQQGKSAAEAADAIDVDELFAPYPGNAFSQLDPELLRAVHLRHVSRAYEVMAESEAP